MSQPSHCLSCGAALASDKLRGLCPRCLMRGALSPQPASDGLETGEFRIPGYGHLRELARGGMGIVYQATQLAPQRQVAIKMLLPQSLTEEMRERFRLEARTMADLNHPGILPLHHFGEWAGVPFFTMKLASGGTLAVRRASYKGQWRKIAILIMELAAALAHAHEHGVLHRDVKPGNILFDENDRAYLADFGLVKLANVESHLTRSVAMLGTPQYIAPEIAAKNVREATVRSDLYSLGAVLYELLAQRPPFQADGLPALLREIAESEPDSLRKMGVPLDLATIAHTCLAKLPARRYGSASALVADLRAWLEDRPISARPVTDLEKLWRAVRRHPALSLLSVLLVAAVVIGMLLQYRANLSLQQTTHQSLTAQVHAIRKSGQWELRNAGLEVARQAAAFENELDLRNDVITLLATPGCRELDRHSFLQPVSTPISPNGQNYAEVRDQQLWIKAFDAATPAVEISPPNSSSVFQEALFFSEDGGALMVVFKDLSYRIWQIKEQSWAAGSYVGKAGPVFSPDGAWIAYIQGHSSSVIVENWRQPTQGSRLSSELENPLPLCFSPDGKFLAVATRGNGVVEIHDALSGERVHRLDNPLWDKNFLPQVAWRPDSQALAIATAVPDLFVWDLDGLVPFRRRFLGHHSEIQAVAWHPSGEWLASVALDYTLRLWDASSGSVGMTVSGMGYHLHFTKDGGHLVLNDHEKQELIRYQLTVPSVVRHVSLPRTAPDQFMQRGPWGVGVSPDGRFAVVGGSLGTWVLDAANGRRLAFLKTGLVNEVSFTADGQGFWLGTPGVGILKCQITSAGAGIWTLSQPRPMLTSQESIMRLSESPATGVLALTLGEQLWLVKPDEGWESALKLATPDIPMNPVAQSPDGRWAVSASCENKEVPAYVWDLKTKTLSHRLPNSNFCYMVFSPDSQTLFSVSTEGVAAWAVPEWTTRWTRPNPGPVKIHNYPAISRDGRMLAISKNAHGVDLFDPATGTLLATIDHADRRSIGWLALDATGSRLVINGSQYNIQLWDLRRLRVELQALHLDWPAPPLPPPSPDAAEPINGILIVPPR